MNNSIKFSHFSCGSQAKGDTFAYPNLEEALNGITPDTRGVSSCDYVPNGHDKFKNGTVYHSGSDSLNGNTEKANITNPIFAKIKGKSR